MPKLEPPDWKWWKANWSPEMHLRLLRLCHNLSVRELARKAGANYESVRKAEQSLHKVNRQLVADLLTALGIDDYHLLFHLPEHYINRAAVELEKEGPNALRVLTNLKAIGPTTLAKQSDISYVTAWRMLSQPDNNPLLSSVETVAQVLHTTACNLLCNRYFQPDTWPEVAQSFIHHNTKEE